MKKNIYGLFIILTITMFFITACNSNGENTGEVIVLKDKSKEDTLFTSAPAYTTEILNDWERDNIKGNPNKMREEEFFLTPSDEMGERTGENTETRTYTESGLVKETFIYDNENKLTDYSKTSFSNSLQKERKIFYTSKDVKTLELIYYYNGLGQQDSTEFIFTEKGRAAKKSEFNNQGYEIQTINYDFNNKISQTALLSYNNNNRVKTILKDANGIDYAISNYEYNDKGDPIKETYYSGNNILFEEYKNIYTYDEKGNWISKKNYLEKIYFRTIDNQKREEGPIKITLRTFEY